MNFRSNGKLLLTAEYLILDGALGLAVPTKLGQSLKVTDAEGDLLHWENLDENGKVWFHGVFNMQTATIVSSTSKPIAEELLRILAETTKLNPLFSLQGKAVICELEFPLNWGLGSSSTLRINLAKWADVSPFDLHRATSSGSGYDIAAGMAASPVLFSVSKGYNAEEIDYQPPFTDQLFFVYLNKKQKSDKEVASYSSLKRELDVNYASSAISALTHRFLKADDLEDFELIIKEHELFMSLVLQRPTIKETLFQDYELGEIKSLGAWGGDFILATGKSEDLVRNYFREKGYQTVLSYSNLIV
jgi:mevalonate kinase